MAPYWERFASIDLGPEARSPDRFVWEPRIGRVAQVLLDPEETNEWRIEAVVDVDASIEQGRAVLRLVDIVDDSDIVNRLAALVAGALLLGATGQSGATEAPSVPGS